MLEFTRYYLDETAIALGGLVGRRVQLGRLVQIREGGMNLARHESYESEWEENAKYDELVDPKFEPYTRIPDPQTFNWMIEELGKAVEGLSSGDGLGNPLHGGHVLANPDLNEMLSAESALDSWNGQAAADFKENFLHPFSSISSNQFHMMVTMKGALEAYQAVCEEARKDIKRIADATVLVLDHARDCNAADWTEFLQVAGAVAAVGGAAVTTGPGAGFAMIGAFAAIGGAAQAHVQRGESSSVSVSGDTVAAVIESMRNSVDTLTAEIAATQKRITDAVLKSTTLVQEKHDYFAFPKPQFAGMPGEQIATDAGLGNST